MNLDEKLDEVLNKQLLIEVDLENRVEVMGHIAKIKLVETYKSEIKEAIKQLIEEVVEDAIWNATIGAI